MTFIEIKNPVIDHSVRGLCWRPYEGHPHGCPNYKKCDRCPPRAALLQNAFDLNDRMFVVYNAFDIASHVMKMSQRHPKWSDRQLRCCLYWQPTARKALRREINIFLSIHPGLYIVETPEAMGLNVTATMASVGIHLEWPPVNVTYQVALAGTQHHTTGI